MPKLGVGSANPKELGEYRRGQKWISKTALENAASTGVVGSPAADVDTFNKIVKQFEAVESQLEGYLPSIEKLLFEPERVSAGNPSELFQALAALQKSLARVSLRALPLTDVQTLRDYTGSIGTYAGLVRDLLKRVTEAQAGYRRGGVVDPRIFGAVEVDLTSIIEKLTVIAQSISLQIATYDSGVAQPMKLGGRFSFHDSAMFQYGTSGFPRG
jgi:hypothetical protein